MRWKKGQGTPGVGWGLQTVSRPGLHLPGPAAQALPAWAWPYLTQHPQPQQALLLGCHHKVVGVILVVYNVFQINAWGDRAKDRRCVPVLCVTSSNTLATPNL